MPLTRRQTLEELSKIGHRPRKQLGQNYLVDGNIVAKSLALAEVEAGDRVVEIGPGLGTLTRSLLEAGAEVWAAEFDPEMVDYLNQAVVPRSEQRLHLLAGDAVKYPRAGLPIEQAEQGFKVVANLPYAVSTPWMDAVLQAPLPTRMVIMLQRETADRFSADPGSKKFGAISIVLQSAFDVLKGHPVPHSCFHPAPEVDSYLLNLRRKQAPFIFSPETRQLMRLLFQQRRKQIGSLVKKTGSITALTWIDKISEMGFDSRTRPEDLPIRAWQQLETGGRESSEVSD